MAAPGLFRGCSGRGWCFKVEVLELKFADVGSMGRVSNFVDCCGVAQALCNSLTVIGVLR